MSNNYKHKIWESKNNFRKAKEFDLKFWKSQDAHVKFIALWDMVKDFYRIKGEKVNGNKLRLQRSVDNIKRIQG